MRAALIFATIVAAGCPSHVPPADHPQAIDDTALRIRIARAEAKRAAGVDELVALATSGDAHQKQLALRGLGRIGTPKAIEVVLAATDDREAAISSAALAALGVAALLDDTSPLDGFTTGPLHVDNLIDRGQPKHVAPTREQMVASIQAIGRAGGVKDQPALIEIGMQQAMPAFVREAVALAFGTMGRRKLAFDDNVHAALVRWTGDADRDVRYAAAYALSREHEPAANDAVNAALTKRILDDDAEIRATAIAGLSRRKALAAARGEIETSLRDRDWRVAVEAVRALAGERGDEAGRATVAAAIGRRWNQLEHSDAEAQIITEALRALAKQPLDVVGQGKLAALVTQATQAVMVSKLTTGWIACLSLAALARARGQFEPVRMCGEGVVSPIVHLPLLADLVTNGAGDVGERRRALRTLLEHQDPRVRGAGIAALATLWKDGDASDRHTIITTLVAALQSNDPIIAGSAVDAAPGVYDAIGDAPERAQLDAAIVKRAGRETDIELGASLFELLGKRVIGAGADACRAGLAGHPVRARAAAACLKALGEAVPAPQVGAASPPPVDVADVIGKDLRWHLTTTRGEIVIQLRPDVAPWNVATIVALTKKGFYDGLEFHRVVPNFVVQGGDPTQSGWGGPGFTTPAEPGTALDGDGFVAGGVGIADAGRDSGGSQWFVMHSRAPHLDGRYTWIGTVVSGQKSADALLIGDAVIHACVETRNYGRSEDVSTACK